MFYNVFSCSVVRKATLACFGVLAVGTLRATPITYGATQLAFNPVSYTLLSVTSGLSIAAVSPATLVNNGVTNVATFPISDVYSGQVFHSGGLSFSKGVFTTTTEIIQNFVFDPTTNVISGTEIDNGKATTGVKFFDLSTTPSNSVYEATVDPQLSALFHTAFGITSLIGVDLGTVTVNATPEPTSLALIGSGLVLAAALTRRRAKRS